MDKMRQLIDEIEACFRKLAFRVSQNVIENKENYYNYILTEYGRI